MPDWLVLVLGASSGLIGGGVAWGTLTVRMTRVERDVGECVRRELYESQSKAQDEKLSRIERMCERVLERLDRETTGAHRRSPSRNEEG